MFVVLSYHKKDQHLAKKMTRFIGEMGHVEKHEIILLTPVKMDVGFELACCAHVFKKAHVAQIPDNNMPWPYCANHQFQHAAKIMESPQFGNKPFLWMEADAVPLRGDWLNLIEREYLECRKPFMGGLHKNGEHHMDGVGVWLNVSSNAPLAMSAPAPPKTVDPLKDHHIAFDYGSRHQHMPLFHESNLFQVRYRQEDTYPENDYSWVREDAAILHTEKSGRVIDYLRAKYGISG